MCVHACRCIWCKLRTRVRKFAVHCGRVCKLSTCSVYKSHILGFCLGLIDLIGLESAGLVGVGLELGLGLALALVLGLMSSVCMTYSNMCVNKTVIKVCFNCQSPASNWWHSTVTNVLLTSTSVVPPAALAAVRPALRLLLLHATEATAAASLAVVRRQQ